MGTVLISSTCLARDRAYRANGVKVTFDVQHGMASVRPNALISWMIGAVLWHMREEA